MVFGYVLLTNRIGAVIWTTYIHISHLICRNPSRSYMPSLLLSVAIICMYSD